MAMKQITISHHIKAPLEKVFDVIAHIDNYQNAVAHIKKVEFLSETKRGVGAKFRETRDMKGREVSSTIEVTEYNPNESVRFVSDEGGTVWDTLFTTAASDNETTMTMNMQALPYKLFAKLLTPFIMGMISKAIEQDMLALKEFCER